GDLDHTHLRHNHSMVSFNRATEFTVPLRLHEIAIKNRQIPIVPAAYSLASTRFDCERIRAGGAIYSRVISLAEIQFPV
ncbi:MAG TPA: hypothetical protein VMD75_02080, partial [Candidatus Binataceae bacterium]|nr:hypothetical protein [Candidatus Binataceae bacterium]